MPGREPQGAVEARPTMKGKGHMKKVKFLAVAAAAFALVALALFGCSSGASSSAASASASASSASAASAEASGSAAASATTALVVGFDAEYPPYGYMAAEGEEGYKSSNGLTYTGFDLDLANAVAQANGWEFEVKPIDWDAKDVELDSGNITCIWNGFTLEGREGQYAFTDPYMINEQVVVVKAGSEIKTLADLKDKKVVTQAGSAALALLGKDGDQAELGATFASGAPQTIADYNNAFMQLDSEQVDAVACDLSIAAFHLAQEPDKYLQLDEALNSEHYAVGFKLGDEATAQTVNDTLKKLAADGTVEKLCEKYADQGITFENWTLK